MSVAIDTEEDDWGSFAESGASAVNIGELPGLQRIFDNQGVRPTYLVNSASMETAEARRVLADLGRREGVEIGTHCHPWNTPPLRGGGPEDSMMCSAPADLNGARIAHTTELIRGALGVDPRCFRAGRWGFGPSVATPLRDLGYRIDASVSPLIDWSAIGGPDFSTAPTSPYRFHPAEPLVPEPDGELMELPTSVGYLGRDQEKAHRMRSRLERSSLSKLKLVGALDSLGVYRRRWLSPENTSTKDLLNLANDLVDSGSRHLALTFHSSTLLPGATPFVRSSEERERFLHRIEAFVEHCITRRWRFATLSDVAAAVIATDRAGG